MSRWKRKPFENPERALTAEQSARFDLAERLQFAGGKQVEIEYDAGLGCFTCRVEIETRQNHQRVDVGGLWHYPQDGRIGTQVANDLRRHIATLTEIADRLQAVT